MTDAGPMIARGPRWSWQWGLLAVPFLLTMELVTRIEDRVAARIPIGSRVTGPADLVWLDTAGARGRPNARYRNWALNEHGFRGPALEGQPQVGTRRIVVVGASETFGLYESPGREYPRQLEDSVRARGGACASVEVVNAALPGMALPSMASLIDRVVRPIAPSHLLLYPSPAFYLNANAPVATRGAAGVDSTLPWSNVLHLRARERLFAQVKSLVPDRVMTQLRRTLTDSRRGARVRASSVPAARLQALDDDLRRTIGAAKALGVPVTLVGHVNATMAPGFVDDGLLTAWEYQFPRVTGQVLMDFHRRARDISQRVARDSMVAYVDLDGAFGTEWDAAFADFVHFTDRGAARVAGTLATALAASSCPPLAAP